MSVPLVTVIIPSYNHCDYIEASILSVVAQTHPAIQLIVIDDGSVDGSQALIDALAQEHGFTFLAHENRGVCATLNRALALAEGEYVVTFGSDDIMLADRIERQLAHMVQHPEVGCVGARKHIIDGQGRRTQSASARERVKSYSFPELLRKAKAVGAPTAMYRLQAMQEVGGYDERITLEDFQMSLRIASLGYRVDILPFPVTCYRVHDRNYSRSYRRHFRNDLMLLRAFKAHPDYLSGRTEVFNRYLGAAIKMDLVHARKMFSRLPLTYWNRSTWRRYREYCLAVARSKFPFWPSKSS
ncbi:MAG: glycosyltransferase [Azonexus sp.]|nr:glycosyltransferase [Azonexus sp.]